MWSLLLACADPLPPPPVEGGADSEEVEAPTDSETGGAGDPLAGVCAEVDKSYEVSWEAWGEDFFLTWCNTCHSSTSPERHGAPEGIDFDTKAQVRERREGIWLAVLEEGTMPLGGGLSDDDRLFLGALLCGMEP